MSFGEKHRNCANFGKKWGEGETLQGKTLRRETSLGENMYGKETEIQTNKYSI